MATIFIRRLFLGHCFTNGWKFAFFTDLIISARLVGAFVRNSPNHFKTACARFIDKNHVARHGTWVAHGDGKQPTALYTPLFKSNRNFFCNVKKWCLFQNIDLQFYELYYEVFWYEQVKFHYISFVRLVSVVVLSQQNLKTVMFNWQMGWDKKEYPEFDKRNFPTWVHGTW